MATKTRSANKNKKSESSSDTTTMKQPSHLNSLVMLGQQLLSLGRFNKGLPSFVTKGVDSEQLWQQLELRNSHQQAITKCTREVVQISNRKRIKNSKKEKAEKKEDDDEKNSTINGDDDDDDDSGHSSDSNVDNVLDTIKKRLAKKAEDDEDERFANFSGSEDDDKDFDFDMAGEKGSDEEDGNQDKGSDSVPEKRLLPINPNKRKNKKKSEVDDKFFKLADMEEYLDAEDTKEEKSQRKQTKGKKKAVDVNDDLDVESSDEDEEDEEIDFFAEDVEEEGANARYTDFFDPPDDAVNNNTQELKDEEKPSLGSDNDIDDDDDDDQSGDEDNNEMDVLMGGDSEDDDLKEEEEDEEEDEDMEEEGEEEDSSSKSKKKKSVSFGQDLFASDEEDVKPETSEEVKEENKSTFEKRQEKLLEKAKEMEELSLKPLSWELTGEVMSSKRPENSLLETVLDFQHTTRAAPVITDDTTKSLEDYIRQRIRDKTWDDVERKEKPKEDVFEFKKRVTLDQEKSKQSLAEIYEQEFVKQQKQDTDEVKADPQCEKIEKDLNKLFQQLDALSNFRYTPMKPGTEVKIVVNTPAITMEEVAPVAATDADLLAPEEIMAKRKDDLKAMEERDETDRKRLRRQKKHEKKEKKKAKESREKKVDKLKPGLGNKYSKAKALKELEQMSKSDKSIHLIKDNAQGKKMASSSAFFSQLQDEVTTQVKAIKAAKKQKKKKSDAGALIL